MSFYPGPDQPRSVGVAKPVSLDDQVAAYERPWHRPWFQTYMDFQPAPGLHTLETRSVGVLVTWHYEWGSMLVRGDRASASNPDILGTIVLGVDAEGDPTIAIR